MTKHWGVVIVGIALATLLVGCSDSQKEQIDSQNDAAIERVGTIPIFELRLGDCFIDSSGFIEATEETDFGEILELTLVACSDASADIEVIRLFTVEREDGPWPGQESIDEQAVDGCPGFEDEFDEFAVYYYPTQESWESGDRTITCLRSLR